MDSEPLQEKQQDIYLPEMRGKKESEAMSTCIICHNRPAVAKGLCITCAAQYGDTGQKPSEIAEENQLREDILAEIAERNRRDRL